MKYRKIHIVFPVLLFAAGMFLLYNDDNVIPHIVVLYNCALFLFIFGVLTLYISLKNKKIVNPFASYFGLGDFVFYISIAPFFTLNNYLLFFIFSMLFAIVLYVTLKRFLKDNNIPLAGFSGLGLALVMLCDICLKLNLLITV